MNDQLTPEQLEERRAGNKALGLHPMFWDTAIELPENPSPEFLDAHFPAWRRVAQDINRVRVVSLMKPEMAS